MSQPLVVTYWLLADAAMSTQEPKEIPNEWKYARFDTTNVLIIESFFVLPRDDPVTGETRYKFGLQQTKTDNGWEEKWDKRYEWVVTEARRQNPAIRIVAGMMMWKDDPSNPNYIDDLNVLGGDKGGEHRLEFANSVKDFLLSKMNGFYKTKTGELVSTRVDGFDIDVELGNDQDYLPDVLSKLRVAFDSVGPKHKFYLSITPYLANNLDASCAASLDFLHMQNYDGGKDTAPESYKDAIPGLKSSQMLWGISSEGPKEFPKSWDMNKCTSVEDAVEQCKNLGLGGIMTWRLNSKNWVFQQMLQLQLFNELKGIASPTGLKELVVTGWKFGGMDKDSGSVVEPFTEKDWIAHNEWHRV